MVMSDFVYYNENELVVRDFSFNRNIRKGNHKRLEIMDSVIHNDYMVFGGELAEVFHDLCCLSIYDSHPELFDCIIANIRKHDCFPPMVLIPRVKNRSSSVLFNILANGAFHQGSSDSNMLLSSLVQCCLALDDDAVIKYCLQFVIDCRHDCLHDSDFSYIFEKLGRFIETSNKSDGKDFDLNKFTIAFLFACCSFPSVFDWFKKHYNDDDTALFNIVVNALVSSCSFDCDYASMINVNNDVHNGLIITPDFVDAVSVERGDFHDYGVFMRLVALLGSCDDMIEDFGFMVFVLRKPLKLYADYPIEFNMELIKKQYNDYRGDVCSQLCF